MKKLSLDAVLLFMLVIPFIMNYRLSPGDTPYWFFGIIFLGLLLYFILDLLKLGENLYFMTKQMLLWFIIVSVIGSAFISAMIVRHQTAPIYMIHDIILQQEAGIRFLLHGKNPYSITYFGTPLEQWHYSDKDVNPALYHFVMEPFYIIFAIPFYVISNRMFGFFDGRIPLVFLFLVLLIFVWIVVKDRQRRLLCLTLFAFNPASLPYMLEGRSDIFMFAFLVGSLFLLGRNNYALAGVPMALAFAVKQSSWPIFPFYVFYLFLKERNIKKVVKDLSLFIGIVMLIIGPFFFWDPKAFLDSTVFYLSGNTAHNYPISGYGFGKVLQSMGVIKDTTVYYPFYIWQFIIGVPSLIVLLLYVRRQKNIRSLIIAYGIFLFIFWYLSRYFNNSHLSYMSMVYLIAYFWPESSHEK